MKDGGVTSDQKDADDKQQFKDVMKILPEEARPTLDLGARKSYTLSHGSENAELGRISVILDRQSFYIIPALIPEKHNKFIRPDIRRSDDGLQGEPPRRLVLGEGLGWVAPRSTLE